MPTITSKTVATNEKVLYNKEDTIYLVRLALKTGLKVTVFLNDVKYHIESNDLILISRTGKLNVVCGYLCNLKDDAFEKLHFDINY